MKIFFKKDYLFEKKINESLEKDIKTLHLIISQKTKEINILKKSYELLEQRLTKITQENEELNIKLATTTKKYNIQSCKNGGLKTAYKKLEEKYQESMTDKYLVRKLPSQKATKQIITFKSSAKNSRIAKHIKED